MARFLFFLFSFLSVLSLKAYDNTENVKFGSTVYPIYSLSKIDSKSFILYETPISDKISVKFNAVVMQGKINDSNVKFELWVPSEVKKDGESYIDYSIIKGNSRIFHGGRFWVRFDIKSKIDSFKIVVINNGVKSDKFEIKIYEVQTITIPVKKSLEVSSIIEDKSLSLPEDIPFKVIRRGEWKANPPKENYITHTPMKITIHHTAGHYPENYEDSFEEIQFIQDYHQNAKGWIDIGYHFLIDSMGNIFEGRPILVVGAHVANKNTNNIGISLMGNYHPPVSNSLTEKTLNSLVTLVKYIKDKYTIFQNEFYAHRDLSATDCPGDIIYARIPEIKNAIFQNDIRSFKVDFDISDEDLKKQISEQILNW